MLPAAKETFLDTRPSSRAGDKDIEMQAHASYILTKPSFDIGEDDPTPVVPTSHNPLTGPSAAVSPHSPHPSYYSASDIPVPSPIPEPVYRYTTGEIASSPPTRAASLRTVRDETEQSPPRSPPAWQSQNLRAAQQNRGSVRSSTSSASNSGIYEMRVRNPQFNENEQHLAPTPNHLGASRGASEASYVTAIDDRIQWLADGGHHQHEFSSHSHDGSHLDDDQTTVVQGDRLSTAFDHDRPMSESSWDGGRAL